MCGLGALCGTSLINKGGKKGPIVVVVGGWDSGSFDLVLSSSVQDAASLMTPRGASGGHPIR